MSRKQRDYSRRDQPRNDHTASQQRDDQQVGEQTDERHDVEMHGNQRQTACHRAQRDDAEQAQWAHEPSGPILLPPRLGFFDRLPSGAKTVQAEQDGQDRGERQLKRRIEDGTRPEGTDNQRGQRQAAHPFFLLVEQDRP